MTIESFVIDFEGKDKVYTLGDKVSGEVKLKLNKELKLREIFLFFYGQGKVEYSQGKTTFVGKQEYYKHVAKLLDEEKVREMGGVLRPGDYTYPFSFVLPFDADLPGTYESKRGYIKYCLEALIDRPNRLDEKASTTITVIDYVEIDSSLLTVQQKQENRNLGYLCCASGSLAITAKLNRGGFYVGDEAKTSVYIDNQTGYDVTEVEICLYQFTAFIHGTSEYEYYMRDRLVDFVKREGVLHGKETSIENIRLTIPELRPTSLDGIIKTTYTIEVIINIQGHCSQSSRLSFPIIIGNIRPPPDTDKRMAMLENQMDGDLCQSTSSDQEQETSH